MKILNFLHIFLGQSDHILSLVDELLVILRQHQDIVTKIMNLKLLLSVVRDITAISLLYQLPQLFICRIDIVLYLFYLHFILRP
jgi:hypothetical protein